MQPIRLEFISTQFISTNRYYAYITNCYYFNLLQLFTALLWAVQILCNTDSIWKMFVSTMAYCTKLCIYRVRKRKANFRSVILVLFKLKQWVTKVHLGKGTITKSSSKALKKKIAIKNHKIT